MWQVVKFTKSFELLSPKCSADMDNRLVLVPSVVMNYFIFHIVLNLLDHSFIFLWNFGWIWLKNVSIQFLLRQDFCLLQMETCLNKYMCLYLCVYIHINICTDIVSVSHRRNQEIAGDFLLLNSWRTCKCCFA